jgi:hypothetical protein
MARRRRSRKTTTESELDSEASTSSGSSIPTLSNDTDAPYIPAYSESRTTALGLFTMYPMAGASAADGSNFYLRTVLPLRITPSPGIHASAAWAGNTDIAVSSILEKMPRIVTTPGDLTDATIRTQIQTYIEGVLDLMSIYFPIAALKGYSNAMPLVSGYIDTYLANIGAKPWQIRQMQTVFRSLPVPPRVVGYLQDFYSVKQHPRAANLHHFIPPAGRSSAETGSSAASILDAFMYCFNTFKATMEAAGGYEEFISYLKLSGYPQVELPTEIAPTSDAKAYELYVNSAPFAKGGYNADVNKAIMLPTSGYKARLATVSRYTMDLGNHFARLMCPVYMGPTAAGWDEDTYTFKSLNTAGNRPKLVSMGSFPVSTTASGVTNVGSCEPGILSVFSNPPIVMPAPAAALAAPSGVAITNSASSDGLVTNLAASTGMKGTWETAVVGSLTVSGAGQLMFSDTIDPNSYDAAAGTGNLANAKQVYDALLSPS